MRIFISILILIFSTHSDTIPYTMKKSAAVALRKGSLKRYRADSLTLSAIGNSFSEFLTDSIIPYWYKRPWTFEGHTDSPDSGTIACGYFVSTTLKHMGVTLNRYKLAQQGPLQEVQSIAIDTSLVMTLQNSDTLYSHINTVLKNGLYIVGLDFHVGFLEREGDSLWFIHSNYLEPTCVVKESLDSSAAFANSVMYYIAPISGNHNFIKKWLFNRKLIVVKSVEE